MDNRQAITVTQLNEYVKTKLETDPMLNRVLVKGEISNFVNHYKTGHFYLSLKDEGGVIRAVMFRMNASKLRFVPENGMKVICEGRVSSYVKDGSVQLYISDMEPDGVFFSNGPGDPKDVAPVVELFKQVAERAFILFKAVDLRIIYRYMTEPVGLPVMMVVARFVGIWEVVAV